uniref:BLTX537 n=1 Tax=Nephila pilipes TaxID=299642 RepID=A0A076KZU7_NEPPI|nr:BLTX537 [Nephila pilipes]
MQKSCGRFKWQDFMGKHCTLVVHKKNLKEQLN